jgi:hypothetical protein
LLTFHYPPQSFGAGFFVETQVDLETLGRQSVAGKVISKMFLAIKALTTRNLFQNNTIAFALSLWWAIMLHSASAAQEPTLLKVDLLVAGGTESGCAAAIQAARMGVKRIALVSDLEMLGGQFTAESLVAIDENRGPAGYGHGVPFPRNGLFKEVIDRIEQVNIQKYGKSRPGNTRVITTCRPKDAAEVFRQLIEPYLQSGQITLETGRYVDRVDVAPDTNRLKRVHFVDAEGVQRLTVEATITVDATDWGEIVKRSGNTYRFGPDLRNDYGEPLAPTSRDDYPLTDMNPITYCMLLERTGRAEILTKPPGYDPKNYRDHTYPKDPMWLYESRRVIDSQDPSVDHQDVVLLCFPAFDYPLDVLPEHVCRQLEQVEKGSSKKNIVDMTRQQRQIVFDDAKQFALGFLYYLQTEGAEQFPERRELFREMRFVDDFGTQDRLPPKPYIRESLRTQTLYVMRQQDTLPVLGQAEYYAQVMYHDGVGAWQFEYDFHPTQREFLEQNSGGPWRATFREGRTWGPPYSGRALLSARALIPNETEGLVVAQKNLGYTSIVSSALRLHDQSMMVGQAAGALSAIALERQVPVRLIPFRYDLMAATWNGLCSTDSSHPPSTLWPFADLHPTDSCFVAANHLAVHRCLPLTPLDIEFRPHEIADPSWRSAVLEQSRQVLNLPNVLPAPLQRLFLAPDLTRGEFATLWWEQVSLLPLRPWQVVKMDDADADGVPDSEDPLPFQAVPTSWPPNSLPPQDDGLPTQEVLQRPGLIAVNFGGAETHCVAPWQLDVGAPFDGDRGMGWKRDLTASHRDRKQLGDPLRDTFLFTRSHDVWELKIPDGTFEVTVCIGDSQYAQVGQNITVEGETLFYDLNTLGFAKKTQRVQVRDGSLTLEIGRPESNTNTCLVWLTVLPVPQ